MQITLLRKDMEFLTNKLLINTTKIIIGCAGLASAIMTLMVKFFSTLQNVYGEGDRSYPSVDSLPAKIIIIKSG